MTDNSRADELWKLMQRQTDAAIPFDANRAVELFEHAKGIESQLAAMTDKYCKADEEIQNWQCASGLIGSCGDPSTVKPTDLEKRIAEDEQQLAAKDRRIEELTIQMSDQPNLTYIALETERAAAAALQKRIEELERQLKTLTAVHNTTVLACDDQRARADRLQAMVDEMQERLTAALQNLDATQAALAQARIDESEAVFRERERADTAEAERDDARRELVVNHVGYHDNMETTESYRWIEAERRWPGSGSRLFPEEDS